MVSRACFLKKESQDPMTTVDMARRHMATNFWEGQRVAKIIMNLVINVDESTTPAAIPYIG